MKHAVLFSAFAVVLGGGACADELMGPAFLGQGRLAEFAYRFDAPLVWTLRATHLPSGKTTSAELRVDP